MTAVEASTVAVAAAMVVAAVVVLIWLWRWLSWRADWLPSTPYKRNKILYVTNPCDILWCNFLQFYFLYYTHAHIGFSIQQPPPAISPLLFCSLSVHPLTLFASPATALGSMFWQTAHTSWYWMIYFVHIAFDITCSKKPTLVHRLNALPGMLNTHTHTRTLTRAHMTGKPSRRHEMRIKRRIISNGKASISIF